MRKALVHRLRLENLKTVALYWRTTVKPHPRQALILVLLITGSAVLDAVGVGMTVPLLDVVTKQGQADHSPFVAGVYEALQRLGVTPSANVVIVCLMVIVSVLFLVRNALFLWSQYCTAAIAVRLRSAMKVSLFERFLRARYEEIAKRSRGTIVHDINAPADALAATITGLGMLCTGLCNVALMISLLCYLSWWATALLGVVSVGGVQCWRWYTDRRAAAEGRALYLARGEQSKLQVDAIDGMRVVKAHGLEGRMAGYQRTWLTSELRSELRLVFFRNGPVLVNEVIAITIVLSLGAVTFLLPELGIRVSTLAAFLLAMRRIAPATSNVNTALVILNQHLQNVEMIDEVLEHIPQEPRSGQAIDQVASIQFSRVSFAYPTRPDHLVVKDFTAIMPRGTVTAVVGPTGAGKSTIANLLIGLYEPLSGSIMINAVDFKQIDLRAWRKRVGYVSQDIFVFNATIKDNIMLGEDTIPSSQMEWAAGVAQLHDFISSLPNGYDTIVGDRGLRLSGGQCQRLAITRAILHQPQVLIFDEATSAMDNLTERAVYNAISTLHHDAIVLVIAHRLGTIREADQILVLDEGQVVERGTHEQLIAQRGIYAKLYEEDISQKPQDAQETEEAVGMDVTSHTSGSA